MGDDEYGQVRKKPLKLNDSERKKKKIKETKTFTSAVEDSPLGSISEDSKVIVITETKAEQAFKAKQDSIAQARILKKASKTHKQRVEEFNKHLDSLSEHYDIPKVSWTK